jgi:hypothetical protein
LAKRSVLWGYGFELLAEFYPYYSHMLSHIMAGTSR